ncbi:RHS repeat-associated core domain-containing protein [Dactylosporangium vinaceum]|uniref:Polymorphic toxin-type HINT domain-containing protein n=2 Tax=Dactylosporangium vinaceum TaxID=53362 RepID=A0ABV5MJQ7_9ACTN
MSGLKYSGRRIRRALAFTLPVVLLATVGAQASAFAGPPKRIKTPDPIASVPGSYGNSMPVSTGRSLGNAVAPPEAHWPAAVRSEVTLATAGDLSATVDRDTRTAVAVPNTPVRLTAMSVSGKAAAGLQQAGTAPKLRVEILPHDTSKDHPVIVRVSQVDGIAKTGGSVRLSLDYSGFRNAYGGDWSSRLRLVSLPECALSTPDANACQATDLSTANDTSARSVSALVPISGATVALTAGTQASDGGGDFGASALAATSSWSAGGESGDFTYSYPIESPPPIAGPAPYVGLGYSSGAMDGLTAATNNQPSWVGEGFDYAPGMINRSYKACTDDGKTGIGDECWGTDNAALTLPGHSGELLQVSTSPDVWKLRADDGTKVERLTGATNGAHNGEHWKVTTTDGWAYWFGLNRLPGWSANKGETASVFTVPVFGNNSGEPCYDATFANAWCDQAATWNLDYVEDPHGNTMSYWYKQELNHYGRNVTSTAVSTYTRAGHVWHIDYGTRKDNGVDSIYSAGFAPARVVFDTADRCETAGSACAQSNPSNWPDVPWDQQCDSASSCPDKYTPAFFTTRKLSAITTQIWAGTGTDYRNVQRWTLKTSMKPPGDGRAKLLWLDAIGHEGLEGLPAGQSQPTPDVKFTAVSMSNRVDTALTKNPIMRMRISSIETEFGSKIAVTYSDPECVLNSNMPASADNNTKLCYPVYWTPYGTTTATFDWFHKYVVKGVVVSDFTGSRPSKVGMQETYQYIGAPAWHYDDNELIPAAHKTWGQWRGYQKVRKIVGAADTAQIQTDTVFFRGMHGDRTSTGTRSVQMPVDADFGGAAVNDEDWRNGQVRETISFNGVGDTAPVLSKTLSTPWEFGPTVTRTRLGVTTRAYVASEKSSTTKLALDGGRGWMTSSKTNIFDAEVGLPDKIGRIVKTGMSNDVSTTADDRCTLTTYATDPSGKILNAVAQQQVIAGTCSATPNLATDLISDVRTWYDSATTFDKTVSKGDVTLTEQVGSIDAGAPVYIKKTEATFDDYGRVKTSKDALNRETKTEYTPPSGSQVTSMSVKNPKLWDTVTTFNPAYGNITSQVDPNGRRTDATYDPLGRATAVWRPGRDKAAGQTASATYGYVVDGFQSNPPLPTSVSTSVLNTAGTGYVTSYQIYDGLMRARQTQSPAVGGGVVLTDTIYDSRGLAVQANSTYFQAGVSWGSLFIPSSPTPGRTLTNYDNAARATDVIFQVNGVEKWRTKTTFGGDHTDTTPPAGGTPSSVWMNATGQTTELRQYRGATPTGAYDATRYTYNKRGNTEKITDSAGTEWSFAFDVRGRTLQTKDPDRGTTDFTYDDADQQLTVTDGRRMTRTSVYDELGRVTDLYQGDAATGALLVHNDYDLVLKGQLSTATRYTPDGRQYSTKVTEFQAGTYWPTKSAIVIPAAEGTPLAGTYTTETSYNPDGSVATAKLPAIGGIGTGSQPAETLTYGYDTLGNPTTLAGLNTYIKATAYDWAGRMTATVYNDGGSRNLAQVWAYEPGTGRLVEHGVYDNDDTSKVYQDLYPSYDNSGRITMLKDLTAQYSAGPDDNQCFRYDYLQHLTNAWTPTNGDCGADPANVQWSALGGPSPYWQSWTYDQAGNRATQKDRTAAGDTTATSTYVLPTDGQPHTLDKVVVKNPAGTVMATNTYNYDDAGNTTTRAVAGRPAQGLTWDAEGQLSSVTDTAGSSSYVYDASGSRLIARDSTGTTLYLGGQEVHLSPTNQVTTTRFYGGSAVRTTAGGLAWTIADQHGTGDLVFKASDLTKTQRRTNPFGNVRGAVAAWPTTRGFVGGITDPTGLTQVGARPYDADLGRFISADPVFNSGDPQAFNSYGYANYNPVSSSDPSGLTRDDGGHAGSDVKYETRSDGKYLFRVKLELHYVCLSSGNCTNQNILMPNVWGFVWVEVEWVNLGPIFKGTTTTPHPERVVNSHKPKVRCPTAPPPPPPPPSCGFFDVKCGWNHPGWWWNGNKGWVEAGGTILSIASCFNPVLCAVTNGTMSAISMADRTYEFVNSGAYKDGWMAAGGFALGMGFDALGFIPGGGAGAHAAEAAGERMLAAGGGCLHSFAPDTPVLLADSTTKQIKDVDVGDEVKSTDPLTGADTTEPVTALHINQDEDLADVTVLGADGASVLHTTQHHPFWNESRNQWTDAADLRPTDRLHAADGSAQTVLEVVVFTASRQMRDLTVGALHTYYVLAGTAPVLVHNCPNPLLGWSTWDDAQKALGPASAWGGADASWEHVVEQSQIDPWMSGFDSRIVNHPDNLIIMNKDLNTAKGKYYSSSHSYTNKMPLRVWIARQGWTYEQQRSFGLYIVNALEEGRGLPA